MISLHRHAGLVPNRPHRRRGRGEPTIREIVLGLSAFLLVAAGCLYLVARLGS